MSGMRWLTSDFDYRHRTPEVPDGERNTAEILDLPSIEIGTGDPRLEIGNLGGLHRMMLEDCTWHWVNGTLLRKLDVDEENGFDPLTDEPVTLGAAIDPQADEDPTQAVFINWLGRYQDVFSSEKNFLWLLKNRDELIKLLKVDPEDALENAENGFDERFAKRGITLDDEDDEGESEDCIPGEYLQLEYQMPRDRYKVVERRYNTFMKDAAERRIRYLKELLNEISRIGTGSTYEFMKNRNPIEQIESILHRLRGAYVEDKELLTEWSQERKTLDKALYLETLDRMGLDEETKRRKLWFAFERQNATLWAIYQDGKFSRRTTHLPPDWAVKKYNLTFSRAGRIPPCLWDLERSRALTELNLTRDQWRKVYRTIWDRCQSIVQNLAELADTSKKRMTVRRALGQYGRHLGRAFVREMGDVLRRQVRA